MTSPPYYQLRSYTDDDGDLEGQVGTEDTPAEYLEALWACAREWWRVLDDRGSLWVNLGDKYNACGYGGSRQGQGSTSGFKPPTNIEDRNKSAPHKVTGGKGRARQPDPQARTKSLLGLPWRYAIGMTDGRGDPDGAGWILRAEVIWAKPNGLPESVRDRVARKHEQWFHFTKGERYYAAVDRVREPFSDTAGAQSRLRTAERHAQEARNDEWAQQVKGRQERDAAAGRGLTTNPRNPRGKLPGSVRTVATEPLRIPAELKTQHFAAFPSEWPRWIIEGWAPTDGVVLDPFGGTGTTAAVAAALGRYGISSDLSGAYNRVAHWRATDPRLARRVRDAASQTAAQQRAAEVAA